MKEPKDGQLLGDIYIERKTFVPWAGFDPMSPDYQ